MRRSMGSRSDVWSGHARGSGVHVVYTGDERLWTWPPAVNASDNRAPFQEKNDLDRHVVAQICTLPCRVDIYRNSHR